MRLTFDQARYNAIGQRAAFWTDQAAGSARGSVDAGEGPI